MSNIEKIAVYDDRIVQNQMKYGIHKGGASVSSSSFNAIGSSTSQITFQVTSPSENIFLDRSFDWESDVYFSVQVGPLTVGGAYTAVGVPVLKLGLDAALCQYPLNSLVTTMTATINDATVSQNNNDTLTEILRLCDTPANREMRTSPYMPDNYQNYNSGYLTSNSPLNGYGSSFGSDYVPNGAFNGLTFTDANGASLAGTNSYNDGTANIDVSNGIPRITTGVTSYKLFFKLTTVEKLVLSPFMFADSEHGTGLYSIQNISFIFNIGALSTTGTSGRLLRHTNKRGRNLTNLAFNTAVTGGCFQNTRIRCLFITPALSLPLPISSVVPYYEFPRYNTVLSFGANTFNPGMEARVESQTITLSNIPDYLIIYVKPLQYGATDADYYYPIRGINMNFDNFNGLMSSHTQAQLYRMSVMNGLHMDYQQFTGQARVSAQIIDVSGNAVDNDIVALTGGFLIIKPGQDYQLSNGLSSGIIGNFTLQLSLTIFNQTAATPTSANLWVIAASSGFFSSQNGQSKVIKGASLTAEEVINANTPSTTRADLQRVIGGKFDFRSLLNTAISKAPDALKIGKIIAPHAKEFMPEEGKKIMSMAGMGSTGGARTGGARSLSSRLM